MSGSLDDDDLDLVAAEYVIGTLDFEERSAFSEKLQTDTDAKRAVFQWETRFLDLAGLIAPVPPPPHVWERIERAVAGPASNARPFRVIEGGGQLQTEARTLKASRDRWRLGALLSGAVAAALLFLVAERTLREKQADVGATYIAAVNRGGDKPAFLVRVDLKTGTVLVRPVAAETPAGHSLELWYIGDDKTPRSMGLVDTETAQKALPTDARFEHATFAVTVEPEGGSKSAGPTGPVIYAGQLIKE
jgi:anti-sigma-K factor RskA